MSYLKDKVACNSCNHLFDKDLLTDGVCRDCRMDESFLRDSINDYLEDDDQGEE